jgi:uncharacterized Zn ribbon protein
MKKFISFSVAFISLVSCSFGQLQQGKNNPWPEKKGDHFAKSMQTHFPGKEGLTTVKNANPFTPGAEIWNFDTIITYDTVGLQQRLTQTFDIQGNALIQLTEQWQTNAWVNDFKFTLAYDTNGNMLTRLIQNWQTNEWANQMKYTYTYDGNGNVLTYLMEQWQNNAWVNFWKAAYTYDANGNLLTFILQQWENNAWVNYFKDTYTYDANGNMLTDLWENWQNNTWVNMWRWIYTYNTNGKMLTELFEEWQSNSWVNHSRNTYTYESNGNLLTDLYEEWQSNAWVNHSRNTYIYDANGNSVTGKYEEWQSGNWDPGEGLLYLYSQKQTIFSISSVYRYEASYVSFITGIAESVPMNNSLSVFPNHSSAQINIVIPTKGRFSILNLSGQQLLQQTITEPTTTIDISILPNGVYLVKVAGENGVQVVKFVKH